MFTASRSPQRNNLGLFKHCSQEVEMLTILVVYVRNGVQIFSSFLHPAPMVQ